jgi:hypothetical protein
LNPFGPEMIEARFLRVAYVAVIAFFCASTTQVQADSGPQNVKAMTFFKGNCQLQIIKGYFPCKDAVMWGEYPTGRASITFFKDNMSFSVSGAGDRQPNFST